MESSERVTNITKDGYRLFRKRVGAWYWVFTGIALAINALVLILATYALYTSQFNEDLFGGLVMVFIFPWFVYGVFHAVMRRNLRTDFWKHFATDKGWEYNKGESLNKERGLMFGVNRFPLARNVITGEFAGLPLRFFEYFFNVEQGRTSKSYFYTVFEFRFPGSFPHLYLNYKQDSYNIKPGKELPLPGELGKKFHLYAPEQYEIEALQVFSPDVLALIEDLDWKCDIELVDQELIVYHSGYVNSRGQLEMEFGKATALVSRLRPTLDRMSFAKIGTNEPYLRGSSNRSN